MGVQRRIRFGPFELDPQTGELWKHGIKVKLQGKPFQVLVALLERPGEPVSREELQQRLWSGDTFVDFESGLNTATNRLRITLGDSAESPRYVETLARSGYRFVAKVEEVSEAPAPSLPEVRKQKARRPMLAAMVSLGALTLVALFWIVRRTAGEPPKFQQITFRRGMITGARFTPDGVNVVYSASWGRDQWKVYLASSLSPETRWLGFDHANVNAVSRSGELLLISPDKGIAGSLSRVPMNGGAPLAVSNKVKCSDWAPDGKNIAAVRLEGDHVQIEFPIGTVRYRTGAMVSCLRVSPDGTMVAFTEHPLAGDDAGDLKLLESNGTIRTLSAGWATLGGLAWSPSGREVWFTAAKDGVTRDLWAVTLRGKLRLVARVPGSLRLEDISRNGRVLLARQDSHAEMAGHTANDAGDRDLSWFDWTNVEDLSADGDSILFDESGDAGGPNGSVYLHRVRDHSTLRLGEGHPLALAPDGRSAAVMNPFDRRKLSIVPIGAGQPREISGGIEYQWARYFPDGGELLVEGNPPGGTMRLYLQAVEGGNARALSPEANLGYVAISPDGKWIAGTDMDYRLVVCAKDGGQRRIVPTSRAILTVGWTADSRSVLVRNLREIPTRVSVVEVASGHAKAWREIGPADTTGVEGVYNLFVTPDQRTYVYSFTRRLAQLFLADGLK